MNAIIETLNSHISMLRPGFYSYLRHPLSDHEIHGLEEKYRRRIPDDLKTLYQWKNGQQDDCYDTFVNNSMFLSLEDALDTAQELNSMIGLDFEIENWWNEHWIPLFHNGSGSYICYDASGLFTGQKGQLIEYWNKDNDRNVIALSLERFLDQLNRYYEKTPGESEAYFIVETEDGYPKQYKVE